MQIYINIRYLKIIEEDINYSLRIFIFDVWYGKTSNKIGSSI
jgi:hypothetical protein